jgi:hypothetical protein
MDQLTIPGYPLEVFYVAAIIGVVLVLFRPRWAFFFAVFCLSIRHFHMAAFTRIKELGPYVNLNDLFLWIGVGAMLRLVWKDRTLWAPNILLAIIGIVVLGSLQSLFFYGFHRDVMQELWRSWIFPIMFLVGANMVRDNDDARLFFWALILGSLGAALQHLVYMQTQMDMGEVGVGVSQLRTISFSMSGGIFLVISALYFDMRKILKRSYSFLFCMAALGIIAISYLLSFTRTVWIGAVMAVVALFVAFYRERKKVLPKMAYSIALLVAIFLIFRLANTFLLSDVNLEQSINERADFIRYEDSFEEAYQTRESGMETELSMWKNGSILWGVGASYPPDLMDSTIEETGALGHVAYSVYLAHFGLIGLLVYAILLPYLTIKGGRRYFLIHRQDYGGALAMTAMALAFFDVFTLLSSNHYIASTSQVPGLIYGAFWGLARTLEVSPIGYPANIMLNKRTQSWLPGPINQLSGYL